MAALKAAAVEVFEAEGPQLDLAGSTDLGIVRNFFEHFGLKIESSKIDHYFEVYHRKLKENLANDLYQGALLPGVLPLLEKVVEKNWPCGLLTGNTTEGARLKVEAFGISEFFHFGAYGSDHHDRNLLGPIAMERASVEYQHAFFPFETLVIGDTPKDIACAKACGAASLIVGTGNFKIADLEEYGPEFLVEDLSDTQRILEMIESR